MSKRVLSALILVGLLSAALGAPASAAQRSLTKQNCEGSGGTFSSDRGVKYCTRVASAYTTQERLGNIGYLPATDPFAWEYKGSYTVETSWHRTTIESQIGNREVLISTEDVQISQSIIDRSCSRTLIDPITGIVIQAEELDRDPAECAALGLYPTL